jgi:spore coat polysaccharide biosynthesis protein SpsF
VTGADAVICDDSFVRTLAIVQARMGSSRLPGKVLADLEGQAMILRQLERVKRSALIDQIVVATSDDASDDGLAEVLEEAGYSVARGSQDDVLSRFILALDAYPSEWVVRITADCPLISPRVIDSVIEAALSSDADYMSNTMTPTFPEGLDVEVVRASVLREVASISKDPHEREHVTLGVYRRQDAYNIQNLADGIDRSELRWTVDTADDLAFVRAVYKELLPSNPAFEYEDVLDFLERNPRLNRTSADSKRNAALDGLDTGAMNV